MGFWSWLLPRSVAPADDMVVGPIVESVSSQLLNQPVEVLWRSQPYLRTVVSFIARNIAQVGMHILEREPDGGRRRVREGPVAELLRRPSADQTWYELTYDLVSTLALYDQAILWLRPLPLDRWELRTIRPSWVVQWDTTSAYRRGDLVVHFPGEPKPQRIPSTSLIVFHGWDPVDARAGSTPVETLRSILAEQWEATAFRLQMWTKGGKVGAYLTRPSDAPSWDMATRQRFVDGFRAQYTGSGGGGVPLLEDGMDLKRIGFSAADEEYIESAKLALTTVASVYHINPTMLGLLDNANYSNVREFRRMLYGDSLGPIIRQIEDRFNAFLMPMLGAPDTQYLEFNLAEKLRGSFEEQANVYQTGVGGPWLTVNEARARENLTAIEGGDDLIRPLNVGVAADDEPADGDEPDADEPPGGEGT